eukprot:scaffold2378_cov152-Skeletonema_menzelii.AAC.6
MASVAGARVASLVYLYVLEIMSTHFLSQYLSSLSALRFTSTTHHTHNNMNKFTSFQDKQLPISHQAVSILRFTRRKTATVYDISLGYFSSTIYSKDEADLRVVDH